MDGLPQETLRLLERLVHTTQVDWQASWSDVEAAFQRDPREVIEALMAWLDDDESVAGRPLESQVYNVCGNALTLLERLTDERICGLGKDWIGFSTHDHRSTRPSRENVLGPWQAWTEARDDVPVGEWFWGGGHRW